LLTSHLVFRVDQIELAAAARGSCGTNSLVGYSESAQAAAELAMTRVVLEQHARRAVGSFAVRLLQILPFVLAPPVVDLDETRSLVLEVTVERLRRVACAARDAIGVGALEA